ncbi:hypothetical protein C8R42DRAFT_723710 [Lentinula raphanica]|nr:hypothetical protein C8R42DRAFT_723710 [Lentinula raphanica]
MHEALTTSTKNYAPDELLPPIYITNRSQLTDSLDWQPDRQALENWPPRRTSPLGFQKLSISKPMSSHPDNVINRDSRWYFDPDGHFVAEALANGIARLDMGDASGEATDDAPIRTPPKNKLATAVLPDTSPLETNSIPSTDSSPKASDHQIVVSHSRGSSTDTTASSQNSATSSTSNTMLAHAPLKSGSINETKERPHSFSGGLSSADLRRLQQTNEGSPDETNQQQWTTNYSSGEQLSYPSLVPNNQNVHHRSQTQVHQGPQNLNRDITSPSNRDVTSPIDYSAQARNFNAPLQPGAASNMPPTSPPYVQGRSGNVSVPYRQPPRGFAPQQGLPIPSPGYAPNGQIPLGNSQQIYDMMPPGSAAHDPAHPALSRVQQQHNVFPRAHHHSASDPTAIRDPAAIAMLNNGMPPFPAGMFPANLGGAPPPQMPMYSPPFYGAQDAYRSDPAVAAAQLMANRIQAQYTGGQYVTIPPQLDGGMSSPASSVGNQNGPSANNRKLGLYKTELCRSWEEKGTCRYAGKCQFAHGEEELRKVSRHPKYKTEICRTFWVSGSCPYGKRCCFIHTELPNPGQTPPGQQTDIAPPPPPRPDGRERSPSTNSDPNEAVSLLARISAKRTQDTGSNTSSTPVDMTNNTNFQFGGAQKQRLKVDTSVDRMKGQNKSAYPTFASNGVLMAAPDNISAKSPAPVTAGPDLGRHNNARMEIVGYNQRMNKTPPTNVRHTTTGSEDISYQASQSMAGNSYPLPAGDGNPIVPRVNGHVRAGSAGNWGNFTSNRPSTQFPLSAYPRGPSPAGEGHINSPWTTTEIAMGPSRLNEKAWV